MGVEDVGRRSWESSRGAENVWRKVVRSMAFLYFMLITSVTASDFWPAVWVNLMVAV